MLLARRDAVLEALAEHLPAGARWTTPEGGYQIWVELPEGIDTRDLLADAVGAGVLFAPGSQFNHDGRASRCLRLSFAMADAPRLRQGVAALGRVLEQQARRRGAARGGPHLAPEEESRWRSRARQSGNGNGSGGARTTAEAYELKVGLAEMLKGGVIMDVTTPEQAKIAEDAGAAAVMALERVPADIRKEGGVARMCSIEVIEGIQRVVSIPVMAKVRIGHFVEARVLEALGVDFIDESEVLTPADEAHHIEKHAYKSPFVCGARDLGEALRRIAEGAAMIRTKGEAGSGNIVEAVRHLRSVCGEMRALGALRPEEVPARAKELGAPLDLVRRVAADQPAAGAELRRRRHRDAGRRGALHVARRGGGLRRLGDLQERGSGRAGARDRARDHALGRGRRGARGEPRAARRDAGHRDGKTRRARAARRTGVGDTRDGRRCGSGSSRSRATSTPTAGRSTGWASTAVRVRSEKDLGSVDALILPGGESTTLSKGLARVGLYEPIRAFAQAGRPILGTCAGRDPAGARGREPPGADPRPARHGGRAQRLRHAGRLVRRLRGERGAAGAALRVHPRAAAAPAGAVGGGARARRRLAGAGPPGPDPRQHLPPGADGRDAGPRAAARARGRGRLEDRAWPGHPGCGIHRALGGAPGPAPRSPPALREPVAAAPTAKTRAFGPRPRGGCVREYETTFIVQPEISDEGVKALCERLDATLEKQGAIRLLYDDQGRRRMAYEIKHFQKGRYILLLYLDDGKVVPEVERVLRLDDSVLRFLTVQAKDDVVDIEARKAEAAELERLRAQRAAERAAREAEESARLAAEAESGELAARRAG